MSGKLHLARRYDTFIFDWDGTLTVTKLLRDLNEKLNPHWLYKKQKSSRLVDKYSVAMPRDPGSLEAKVIRRHIRNMALENELVTPLADISIFFFRPKLHNGARELLKELKKRRTTIALFSNGAAYRVIKELSYLGIEDYFSAIVSAQDIGALKPHPAGLKVIMESLGAKRQSALYLGDRVSDIETAKYAGIDSCALGCGFDRYDKLRGSRPTYIFRNIEQLLKAI